MEPEEAIKRIENLIRGREDPRGKTELDFALDMAVEALKEQKPHGEWIYHKEWELDGECAFECSKCGMGTDTDYNFCPNCGLPMKKEGEAE